MAVTYTPIATSTLSSASSSVTFSSIPSTYTDLVLVLGGASETGVGLALRFNGDTSTNYSNTYLGGSGTTAISGRATNAVIGRFGNIGTTNTTATAHIMNYSNTSTYKTTLGRASSVTEYAIAYVSLWRSTSAINSVVVLSDNLSTNFIAGTTFTLYGIQAA